MAQDEAKVRVRLDTQQAKAELDDLGKKGQVATNRIGAGVRRAVKGGLRAIGLGAAIGAGVQAVRGAASSGLSDVVGEMFGGYGSQFESFVFGNLSVDARADRTAREETKAAFGMIVGAAGKDAPIPPGVKSWFDSVQSLRYQEELGKQIIESSDDFRGVKPMDLIERLKTMLEDVIKTGVGEFFSHLPFFGSR